MDKNENVGTEGHIDHNASEAETAFNKKAEAAISTELTPEMIQQLLAMRGGQTKRGITKPVLNRAKRKARSKQAKASRKSNR
jgi:hypothetical protein